MDTPHPFCKLLFLVLVGCDPKSDTEQDDNTPTPDSPANTDTPDDTGDSETHREEIDCTGSLSVQLGASSARPGEVVPLSAEGLDAVTWSVTAGTVGDESALETHWTLPEDAARYDTEVLVATASGRVDPACDLLRASGEVEVGRAETERVVVLYNPEIKGSQEVAEHYADFRGLSAEQLCEAPYADATTVPLADVADFFSTVMDCVEGVGSHVHYLVPVYGVPYKISGLVADFGTGGYTTTSLDASLVLGRAGASQREAIWNPFYLDGDSPSGVYAGYVPLGELKESVEAAVGGLPLYLVTRIDGESAEAAMELVDRTAEAEALAEKGALAGTVYVDGRYGDTPPTTDDFGSYQDGEWDMWGTRRIFEDLDWYPVIWDGNGAEFGTAPAPEWCEDALYYAGWYSFNHYNDAFAWTTGAIGGHLDSCSACNIRDGSSWSGGALQRGITATFGAVNEPYVAGMPEYDQFFLYLTQGASFAEAAYESTIVGVWMMTWVGDPLYRPYP